MYCKWWTEISTWVLAVATEKCGTTIHRLPQIEALLLFHVQRMYLIQPDDHRLCSGFLTEVWYTCISSVPCCSVTSSPLRVFITHNAHMWTLNSPHSARPRAAYQRFTVDV
ncbi:hypothetical protein TNCV_3167131 [Trichonephila clavipes]|uniref:Uncharacterized protein n=1 Tax=Trichonephila clavipes TaxID=2585209 RepID=A0A8X6RKA4_TRICX|nr:hypothetical protein TNCV_3167131 [Trichonephila clavipes]